MITRFRCFLHPYEEAKAETEQAMQQVRALQEMLRTQSSGSAGNAGVEIKVIQRNLEATQAELEKTKSHLEELEEDKKKVEQNMAKSQQDLQDLQKVIDDHVAAQNNSLKLEFDAASADLKTTKKRVGAVRGSEA